MKRRMTVIEQGDCTGLGRWLGWLIVALVLGGMIAFAFTSNAQSLAGGAGLSGGATTSTQRDAPVTPDPGLPCDDDITPPVVTTDGFIVSNSGSSGNTGLTTGSPLDVTSVFTWSSGFQSKAAANPTRKKIYLRGGIYAGFPSGGVTGRALQMVGTVGSPWIIQSYPGEMAIFRANSTTAASRNMILVTGSAVHLRLRNITFTDDTHINMQQTTSSEVATVLVKNDTGDHIWIENCIFHDSEGSAILTGSGPSKNLLVRGCLFYNIGAPMTEKHHGIYAYNRLGASGMVNVIADNLFMNCMGYGIHCYDSVGPVGPVIATNNIVRTSGGQKAPAVFRVEPPITSTGVVVTNNVFSTTVAQGTRIGNNLTPVINDNYFQMNGGYVWFSQTYDEAKFLRNTLLSTRTVGLQADGAFSSQGPTFDFNTYVMSDSTPFQENGSQLNFADWKADTSEDASSTLTTSTTTTTIKYIHNSLDPNLVYFAIMNEGADPTVNIDLRPYWPTFCGTYEIVNAGDYEQRHHTALTGNWTGQSSITITMTGQQYAQPRSYSGGSPNPNWTESTTFYAGVARRTPAN